jgi:hypothetical protein
VRSAAHVLALRGACAPPTHTHTHTHTPVVRHEDAVAVAQRSHRALHVGREVPQVVGAHARGLVARVVAAHVDRDHVVVWRKRRHLVPACAAPQHARRVR